MKKLLLMAGATGIALGLVSAGAAGARSQATRVQIAATMVAGEETPTPKGDVSAARGSFTGTLTKTDTGAIRTVFSGADGAYALPNLPVGPYELKVVLQGFNTYIRDGIVLQVGSNPEINVTKQDSSAVLVWRLTFSRLTGKAIAAHIHSGVRGKAGPVIVPLCTPCRTGARGRVTVDASVLSALQSGRTYVNVHTTKNPAGEIRGQLGAAALTIS